MTVNDAARVTHEVVRAYCEAIGDHSQPPWEQAPDWQKDSAVAGVRALLADPTLTPEQSHELWMTEKAAQGWDYGPVKDVEKKLHPAFVPYRILPVEQKAKDYIFVALVKALMDQISQP